MGLGDTSKIEVANPFFVTRSEYEIENPHVFVLELMRKPEHFFFTAKHVFNKILPPLQLAILRELWIRPVPMLLGSRGMGKSFILAMYAMIRALLCQGSKIVIVGAAFRQAKVVFDYCQEIWENAPVLRDMVGQDKRNGPRRDVDRCSLRMGDSIIIALPLGDGTKIRGQRANIILADEFASIPKEIFETVVRGFTAVSQSPIEKLQRESRKAAIKDLGKWSDKHEQLEQGKLLSNQTVVSGTAYYSFNHFYEYWKQYKAIIESRGDRHKLGELFNGEIPENFNHKDYSIIRVPYQKLPKGFMDEKQIGQAKATVHIGTFQMEYGAVFATDSNGFFKRSLVESCVSGKPLNPIEHPSCGLVKFNAVLRGDVSRQYVMAIDPASEQDNFSIVILELWPEHRRIVFCWTTTRKRFKAKVRAGLAKEGDFYGYTARKIRELLKVFSCPRIAMDSQGGGVAVMEALQDKDKLQVGERPMYPIVVEDEPRDTDDLPGEHIIEVINFAKADWVRDANHGMRKDFEDHALLFPEFNAARLSLSLEEDKETGRVTVDSEGHIEKLYDTLEDCFLEIEAIKDELASIVHTQTGTSMRDRWDTPETKEKGGKKGRLRKDRYSSILMANMVGRTMQRAPVAPEYQAMGGFAHELGKGKKTTSSSMWIGPDWWTQKSNRHPQTYGAVVKR
jgi:hypothetical protein